MKRTSALLFLFFYRWGKGCQDTVERNSHLNLNLARRSERDAGVARCVEMKERKTSVER